MMYDLPIWMLLVGLVFLLVCGAVAVAFLVKLWNFLSRDDISRGR